MILIHFIVTVIALFSLSLYCLVTERNIIKLLLAIAIIFNASNLNFIAMAAYRYQIAFLDPLSEAVVILVMAMEACFMAVGLTVAIFAYKYYKTLDVRKLARLKW